MILGEVLREEEKGFLPAPVYRPNFVTSQTQVNGSVTIDGAYSTVISLSDESIQIRGPQVFISGLKTLILTANGKSTSSSFNVAAPVASSQSPVTVSKSQLLTINGFILVMILILLIKASV